jgi:hypothetical protein
MNIRFIYLLKAHDWFDCLSSPNIIFFVDLSTLGLPFYCLGKSDNYLH